MECSKIKEKGVAFALLRRRNSICSESRSVLLAHKLSDTDRAYLAGLLDRSCFIGIIRYSDKGRTKYTARVTVQCSNRGTLKPLFALLGGKIKRTKQSFSWSLTGRRRCAESLTLLLPFLQVRRDAARKVIQFDEEWTRVEHPYEKSEIIAHRDRFVEQSVGLKMSWRKESRGEAALSFESAK